MSWQRFCGRGSIRGMGKGGRVGGREEGREKGIQSERVCGWWGNSLFCCVLRSVLEIGRVHSANERSPNFIGPFFPNFLGGTGGPMLVIAGRSWT